MRNHKEGFSQPTISLFPVFTLGDEGCIDHVGHQQNATPWTHHEGLSIQPCTATTPSTTAASSHLSSLQGLANSAGPTSDHCRAAGSPAAHVCDPDAAVYCVTDPAHFLRVPTHDLYAALRDDLGGAHRLQKGCGFPHVAAERTQAADQEFNFWWWLCVCHTA